MHSNTDVWNPAPRNLPNCILCKNLPLYTIRTYKVQQVSYGNMFVLKIISTYCDRVVLFLWILQYEVSKSLELAALRWITALSSARCLTSSLGWWINIRSELCTLACKTLSIKAVNSKITIRKYKYGKGGWKRSILLAYIWQIQQESNTNRWSTVTKERSSK